MPVNLYIAGAAPRSGKAAVSLGFMERLAASGQRVGFFRPIVADTSDPSIGLMRERYGLGGPVSDYYGLLAAEAHQLASAGRHDALIKVLIGRFKAVEARFDAIVCEGCLAWNSTSTSTWPTTSAASWCPCSTARTVTPLKSRTTLGPCWIPSRSGTAGFSPSW